MWVTLPIGRRSRVILPWFIAIPLIPLAAGFWVLSLTWDVIRWVWRRPRRPDKPSASVRITVR